MGKNPNDVQSYRPISLLPVIAKILEKLLLTRLLKEAQPLTWIPTHQFGFRKGHSTTQQRHRLTDIINKTFEDRKYCNAVFLDVSQAFDKVWHPGLLAKIQQNLPTRYFAILRSYLQDRYLTVSFNNEKSYPVPMLAGVPQGSMLGPLLYTLYTADIPQTSSTLLSTFADDTAVLAIHPDPVIASRNLQDHLSKIERWTKKWRLKINETKSAHITFTLRKNTCPPVYINNSIITRKGTIKYLGLHFDKRLTWKEHVLKTRKHLDQRTRELYWLIGKTSPLSLSSKVLIYNMVLKTIWMYGLGLWGCASASNTAIIQRYQQR